jgi:hypothetical protein
MYTVFFSSFASSVQYTALQKNMESKYTNDLFILYTDYNWISLDLFSSLTEMRL